MDGATGTEVERRGAQQLNHAWNGGAALSDPEIVRSVHKDYIMNGSELIITNTFANTLHALTDAGEGQKFEKYNSTGVKLAIESREAMNADHVCIAGGISYWTYTNRKPSLSNLESSVITQAQVMKDSGADLLILEMMIDIEQMMVTFNAAKTAALPIWVGLTCELNDNGNTCLRNGDSLQEALDTLIDKEPDAINIMHTEVADVLPALKILNASWNGPVGVYAHSGKMINQEWTFNNVLSPREYQEYAECWINQGINFIGGCCGINVDHIKMLNETINKQNY